MKRFRTISIILMLLLCGLLLFSGCNVILVSEDGEKYSGETEVRTYDYTDFTRVDIGSSFSYRIEESDEYSVTVTAGEKVFDNISIEKAGNTLVIDTDHFSFSWSLLHIGPHPKVVITMPKLERLEGSGATEGTVSGFDTEDDLVVKISGASRLDMSDIVADDFTLNVSGAGNVEVDIIAQDMSFDISGASRMDGDIETRSLGLEVSGASSVELDGSADEVILYGSGASSIDMDSLVSKYADVVLSGASNGTIHVTETLDVSLTSASRLSYTGDPELGDVTITTASDLRKK